MKLEDGTRASAPIVISGADLKTTFTQMLEPHHLSKATRRRIDRYRMAWPLFNVYIGLDIDLSERMSSAQIWRFRFDGDFGVAQRALDWSKFNGDREAWLEACETYLGGMIHIATNKDAESGLAPPGMSSIEVMTYVPPNPELWGPEGYEPATDPSYRHNEIYQHVKERVTDHLVSIAEDVIPDIRSHIVWIESGSPATQQRYTRSTDGGSYGVELSWDQVGPRRQGTRTEIDGLYIAGASAAYGPGVENSMLSGIGAAGAALNRNLILEVRGGAVFGDRSALPRRDVTHDPLERATVLPVKGGRKRSTSPAGGLERPRNR